MYFYLEQKAIVKDGKLKFAEKFNSHGKVTVGKRQLASFAFINARAGQRVFVCAEDLEGEGMGKGVTLAALQKAKATKVVGVSMARKTKGATLDI